MGAGAQIILTALSYRMVKQMQAKTAGFFAIGANVFGLLAGLYLAFVVTDQLSFYSSRTDTGMLSWAIMKDAPSLRDIRCESDFLIVRGFHSIYGCLSGAPIVPWPGFTEGKSVPLALALKKLQNEAIHT